MNYSNNEQFNRQNHLNDSDSKVEILEIEDDSNQIDILEIEDDTQIDVLDILDEENVEILDFEDSIDVLDIKDEDLIENNKSDNSKPKINDESDIDKEKLKKLILIGVLIIILVCLSFVIYKIVRWKTDNDSTNKQISDLQNEVKIEEIEDNDNTVIFNQEVNDEGEVVIPPDNDYYNFINTPLISVDIESLKLKNKDTVGWLKVNGTNINYPIVKSYDNDYYLNHSFDGKYNDAGWVFVDYRNNMTSDRNMIIYGHSRLNLTMFGTLKNVVKPNWYNDSNNHLIMFSTEKTNTSWQVFSTYITEAEDYYIRTAFVDNKDYLNFLNVIKNRSIHDYNVFINENDRILTLSTCYTDNKRVVLHAKLIKMENR